ncbi:MAG: hypothetical protein GX045_07625 [Clostridiaceae bacterium]|jgi:hypothetical protein|nr:hypothetical protein [Clostridiaceae bacterium]
MKVLGYKKIRNSIVFGVKKALRYRINLISWFIAVLSLYFSIEKEVQNTIEMMKGFKFILGGDCTLPAGIPYERIRKVVEISKRLSFHF